MVVILTKHAFLFLADIEMAQVIYCIQLACDILFATVLDENKPHSLLGICRSGKVSERNGRKLSLGMGWGQGPAETPSFLSPGAVYLCLPLCPVPASLPASFQPLPLPTCASAGRPESCSVDSYSSGMTGDPNI